MFERFTPHAHHVVALAQQESDRLGHNYLGPEHVLAGIAGQTNSRAARMLRTNGVDLDTIRAEMGQLVSRGILPPPWRHDATLLRGLGIDLAAVRRNVEQAFGGDAVDDAVCKVSRRSRLRDHRGRRSSRTPLSGKAMWAKQAFYLAGVAADDLGQHAIDSEHLLLGILGDARVPVVWSRRNMRMRANLGFAVPPGPHPVKAVIEGCGLTVDILREAILAELHPTP